MPMARARRAGPAFFATFFVVLEKMRAFGLVVMTSSSVSMEFVDEQGALTNEHQS